MWAFQLILLIKDKVVTDLDNNMIRNFNSFICILLKEAVHVEIRQILCHGWHMVNLFPPNFWFHWKAELTQMSKQRVNFPCLQWMGKNMIFKFFNKIAKFCINLGIISSYFPFSSAFDVFYYSKIIDVNWKPE